MRQASVHLCGREISDARHVCAFVASRDEEHAILDPFVKEGLQQGERVLQIVDARKRSDHEARLARAGVDLEGARERGQLSIAHWEEVYLQEGYFDAERMLSMLQGAIEDRRARGYPLLRATGNMEWALLGAPGTEQLLEYEARVNVLSAANPDVFVCVYDVNKFPANTVVDVLRTHPAVIIGGVYHENPYFVPPERMLKELVARGKAKRL